jgi:HTH-type transcriptional regulator/antitoxin HipB
MYWDMYFMVRLKRQEKGLSQSALAAKLGVGRKWIIHLESGNPKAELGLILKALECAPFERIAGRGEAAPAALSPSRLDEVFRHLQRSERKCTCSRRIQQRIVPAESSS